MGHSASCGEGRRREREGASPVCVDFGRWLPIGTRPLATVWTTQAQSTEPEDALQIPRASRPSFVRGMRRRRPRSLRSHGPCRERLQEQSARFCVQEHSDNPSDLSAQGVAVMLARKLDHRAVLRRPVARLGESAVVFPQLFAAGGDIKIALWFEGEVAARKRSVRPLGPCRSGSRTV